MKDQTYRGQLISYLSNFISSDTCYKLLLGSDDVEIVSTFSIHDINQVRVKARHICDALTILVAAVNTESPISWLKCCELATIKNYNIVKRARTIADWYLQLHQYESLKFCRSMQGKASSMALSPFAEDESLTVQFKSWARVDLEHLNIKKSAKFYQQETFIQLDHTTTQSQ